MRINFSQASAFRRHENLPQKSDDDELYSRLEEGRLSRRTSSASINPNRTTLPCGSWPCERAAARIENEASSAILSNHHDEIYAKLMQASRHQKIYKVAAVMDGISVILSTLSMSTAEPAGWKLFPGALAAGGVLGIIPHVGVYKQFSRVREECEKSLVEQFGQTFLDKLKKLGGDEKGLEEAIRLFSEAGASTDFLAKKLVQARTRRP